MGALGSRKTKDLIEYKTKLSFFSELNFCSSFHGLIVGNACGTMMCFVLCAGSKVPVTFCLAALALLLQEAAALGSYGTNMQPAVTAASVLVTVCDLCNHG